MRRRIVTKRQKRFSKKKFVEASSQNTTPCKKKCPGSRLEVFVQESTSPQYTIEKCHQTSWTRLRFTKNIFFLPKKQKIFFKKLATKKIFFAIKNHLQPIQNCHMKKYKSDVYLKLQNTKHSHSSDRRQKEQNIHKNEKKKCPPKKWKIKKFCQKFSSINFERKCLCKIKKKR